MKSTRVSSTMARCLALSLLGLLAGCSVSEGSMISNNAVFLADLIREVLAAAWF